LQLLMEDPSSKVANHSGHATTHDTSVRSELKLIIQELDCEYYNGQIAFVDRIIPCGHKVVT
jgi:hypothetical protein